MVTMTMMRAAMLGLAGLALAGCSGPGSEGEVGVPAGDPTVTVDGLAPAGPRATDGPPTSSVVGTSVSSSPGGAEVALPVAEIDFDRLYRSLDDVRGEAYRTENAELLATVEAEGSAIERLRAEAADTATSWDRSEQTYTVRTVEVFRVVDDNRVLLTVVDEVTGTRYRRDATGAVVEELSRQESPVRQFLVLLDRTSGRWMINYDALSAPIEYPMPRAGDFTPAGTVDVGGQTVSFAQARPAGSTLGCFLVTFPGDAVPQMGCQVLPDYDDAAVLLLFRSPDGAHEALVAVQGFRTAGAVGLVEPDRKVPLDQPIGTWSFGVAADETGAMRSFTWGGTLGDNNVATVLDDLRAEIPPGEAAVSAA